MTYIYIDPFGTTSLLTTTSTIDDTIQDDDLKSTTMMGITSSLVTSLSSPASADMYYTNQFIDSLTDTELVEMTNKLENQTIIDVQNNNEKPKIYQKTIDI